jgi:hypothetical protein
MKAKIFSFVKTQHDSIIASARIARFTSELLQLPIVCDDTVFDDGAQDVLIIVGGAYAFSGSRILETLGNAIQCARRLVWIQNDYSVIPPKDQSGATSPFRAAFRMRAESGMAPTDFWTTCEHMSHPGCQALDRTGTGWKCGPGSRYVNWNALTLDTEHMGRGVPHNNETLLYYGSFREGQGKKSRLKYFDRYFSDPTVPIVISSPSRKFEEHYKSPMITHESKMRSGLSATLSTHRLGLYLEDELSHSEFHSPANRFYEMLSAGLPMAFQPEAQRMMARAGYEIGYYCAWPGELPVFMEKAEQIGAEQRERWSAKALEEHRGLTPLIEQLWKGYQS